MKDQQAWVGGRGAVNKEEGHEAYEGHPLLPHEAGRLYGQCPVCGLEWNPESEVCYGCGS